MRYLVALLTLFIMFSSYSSDLARPYTTDGCTGWFDSWRGLDWSHCCYKHDLYYWAGGERKAAQQANKELKSCVRKASGRFNSFVMNIGVRMGAFSPIKLKGMQWGNAWGNEIIDHKLSNDQIQLLENSLFRDQTRYSNEEIQHFIKEIRLQNLP